MTVKIGINGFGRIGRLAFRRIFELQARGGQAGDIEVAEINDLTTPSMLAYLLKYDSTHGTFRHDDGTPVEVTSTEDSIVVDGKEYKVYAEKDANNIPWVKNDGVEFVLECTGFYTSAEKSQAHINAGAKKVLISAPAKDETTPTVVFGVNHEILKASDVIVSAGSCTTNSMAAMVKLLDENWGIKAGFMTTIHAYTGTQMILDGPRFPKARNNRAAAINTIPHSTGAAKAIGLVSEVYPAEELMDKAMELANAICANAQIAVCESKRCIRMGMQTDIHTGSAFEAEAFGVTCGTEDKNEGMGAFLEKRAEKHFQNR